MFQILIYHNRTVYANGFSGRTQIKQGVKSTCEKNASGCSDNCPYIRGGFSNCLCILWSLSVVANGIFKAFLMGIMYGFFVDGLRLFSALRIR